MPLFLVTNLLEHSNC